MDGNGRPDDYGELFERYFGMVRRICERQTERLGGQPEDAEDLVQLVMLRFMEWDGLTKYEPRKLHKTKDGFKTARFPTFLRAFATRFVWDLRDTYKRRGREVLTSFDVEVDGIGSYRFDEDVETSVFIQAEMNAAWVYLGSVRLSEAVTAADVFEVMVDHVSETGKTITATDLGRRFSVSRSVATEWRRVVMDQLDDLGWPAVFAEPC